MKTTPHHKFLKEFMQNFQKDSPCPKTKKGDQLAPIRI